MKHRSGAPLQGRLLALLANIILGWKGLPGTNDLVYYENCQIKVVKWFIVQAQDLFFPATPGLYYKTFYRCN